MESDLVQLIGGKSAGKRRVLFVVQKKKGDNFIISLPLMIDWSAASVAVPSIVIVRVGLGRRGATFIETQTLMMGLLSCKFCQIVLKERDSVILLRRIISTLLLLLHHNL